jgi:hypothetical protein
MIDWKSKQNHDGGWAYSRGCSWTEPTVFALLAQSAVNGRAQQSFSEGIRFIRSMAGPDGGFRPQPGVAESTWVTSVVALLPREALGEPQYDRAIEWLKGQTGRESGWRYRLQQRFAGSRDEFPEGWPWYPGAAAWVIPTSLGILAFQRARDNALQARIDAGREFLLSRMCADGGWNHGSSKALGRDGDSYPETTGIALFALRGIKSAQIERSKAAARSHLASCRNAEGVAWLRMALAVHGEPVQQGSQTPARTTLDLALLEIASADRNPLL